MSQRLSRRKVLSDISVAAAASLLWRVSSAQTSSAPAQVKQLPLRTTGLEHMGTVVPDVTAAAKFYGRVFNPEVHKEKELPLRYYVVLGKGYLALGSRANQPRAFFDHFCALVKDYDAPAMAEELKSEGMPGGRFGIIPDPDALGLQLLGEPGGLAKSTEPAGRIVEENALVRPIGLESVTLHVADLQKSLQFYRKFFGREKTPAPERAVFQIADTRLLLASAPGSEAPRIAHIGIKTQPFDRSSVSRELTKLGAQVTSGSQEPLRFTDPVGLGIELLPA
jgi:catechol 2,3-dioxygenase-like lactoylglutathione lyase family enzyme